MAWIEDNDYDNHNACSSEFWNNRKKIYNQIDIMLELSADNSAERETIDVEDDFYCS